MTKLRSDNPARLHEAHIHAGFTLLEMSIVVAIIAVIVAGTLSMGSSMVGSAKLVNTNNKLDAIEKALMAYRLANDRLPCPADPTLTDVNANSPYYSANYGYEAGTPGYCTLNDPNHAANPNIATYTVPLHSNIGPPSYANNPPPPATPNLAALGMSVAEGAVPVKALGLPDEFQFDGWGKKIAYAVTTAMTSAATGTGTTGNTAAFVSYGVYGNCGALTVQNGATTLVGGIPVHTTNRTQVADYVLLSYGPDGHGGYMKSGVQYFMGSDNTDELTNCHCTASGPNNGAYTGTYIQQDITQTDPNDSLSAFDDIVRYKERWQMQNAYDAYHPGSQLPCTNGFQVQGIANNDTVGHSIATGDINGDNIPDLILGSGNANITGTASGAVYVIFGTTGGFPDPLPISSLNGTNGFELDGASIWDSVGNAVATGDVNGDGIDDLIIGAFGGDGFVGYTYVVFGKSGPWTTPQTLNNGSGNLIDGKQGVQFTGTAPYNYFGWSVAAGDINGDGYADVIIAAPWAPNGGSPGYSPGYTYVVFGKPGGWVTAGQIALDYYHLMDGIQGIRFDGVTSADPVFSVATGDINGDGIADLIMGAPGANNQRGYVHAVFGKSTSTSTFLPGTTITSLIDSTHVTVASYTGLQVGQTLAVASGIPPGTTITACGPSTVCSQTNITLSSIPPGVTAVAGTPFIVVATPLNIGPGTLMDGTRGVRFDGVGGYTCCPAFAGDALGWSVATGDVNGDGIADLIMGAYNANGQGGYVYVVFGKRTSWSATGNVVLNTGYGNLIDGVHGIRFDGMQNGLTYGNWFGYSVSSGDINGDGLADIIIGAPQPVSTNNGKVDVIFGNSSILPTTTIITTANSPNATVGSANNLQVGQYLSAATIPSGTYISWCGGGTACTQKNIILSGTGTGVLDSGGIYIPLNVATTPLNIGNNTLINGITGAEFNGAMAGDQTGWSVNAGDINGDGISDLIIGAPSALSNYGNAYIYNGRASGWPNPANYGGSGYPLGPNLP